MASFKKAKTTPLSAGLALTRYQANRSRSDVQTLNNLQVAVTYDEVDQAVNGCTNSSPFVFNRENREELAVIF